MPDIKRILCPVDSSDASAHAVDQAIAIAGWYKARITALHVHSPLLMPAASLPPPAERESALKLQRARDETAASFHAATAAGVDVDVAIEVGQPASVILDCAVRLPADLIVMGTHGAGGFEHFVLGSVAEKVLRRAACPVLTVPPRSHAGSALPFKRVLCAVDFSDSSLTALHYALSIADESGAALTLLHVLEWPWHEPPAPVLAELPHEQAAALAEFRRYLEASAMGRLKTLIPDEARPRRMPGHILRHGKPYEEILRLAGEEGADLIVIGVHGRNFVDLTVFGSTTNQVVRRAACPVLTLKQ